MYLLWIVFQLIPILIYSFIPGGWCLLSLLAGRLLGHYWLLLQQLPVILVVVGIILVLLLKRLDGVHLVEDLGIAADYAVAILYLDGVALPYNLKVR